MSRKARYDPSDAAIGSAYVSSFNDYVRRVLKYGEDKSYRPSVDDIGDKWDYSHQPPDGAGKRPAIRPDGERDAGSGACDDDQSVAEGAAQRRIFRSADAVFPGQVRDAAFADSRRSCAATSNTAAISPGIWCI